MTTQDELLKIKKIIERLSLVDSYFWSDDEKYNVGDLAEDALITLDKLIAQSEELQKRHDLVCRTLGRMLGHGYPFMCGHSPIHNEEGFPDTITMCIALGADPLALYKRVDPTPPESEEE